MALILFGVMGLIFVFAMSWKLKSATARPSDLSEMAGRPLTLEEYYDLGEIRLELIDGYIDPPEMRTELLRALIINEGLIRVVRLAPRQAWREALKKRDDPM